MKLDDRRFLEIQLTVPLIETRIVPVMLPKRRPADMVKGIAGIARIYE